MHIPAKTAEKKSRKPEEARESLETLGLLWGYLWPKGNPKLKARVVAASAFLFTSKIIATYVPFLLKRSIDALSVEPSMLVLPLGLLLSYSVARILQQGFGELRDLVFAKNAQHAQRILALQVFEHLHRLSLRFHLDRQTGGLTRVIERGVRGIQTVLSFMIFNILPTIVEIAMVSVILSTMFDWRFSTVTVVTIASYIAYTVGITNWRTEIRIRMNQRDTEANTKAIDSLLNYETVKYFGNEELERDRYDVALRAYEQEAIRSQNSLSVLNLGQGFIIGMGLLVLMVLAGIGVVEKSLTVGDFVLVNTYLIQLYLPLNILGFAYREIKQGLVDMDKLFDLLQENAEVADLPDARALAVSGGEIRFEDVSFNYNADRQILKNISFHVKSGETVALVGSSGSGKSTIARLLYRFYDTNGGRILIDGQDIRNVTQKSLRSQIGTVPQDTVLFNDTLEYNIHYGKMQATKEQVAEAAARAQLSTFISRIPQGMQTTVGERGLKLSGGEKQRVAIARAVLKNPPILILDEATSSLDSQTEKEIQSSLKFISKNRTTLVIAHRLSTIVDADQILVLKDGEIVERGRHDELLRQDGEYAAMWRRQLETQDESPKKEEVRAPRA
ncbi:MAG: ABC transporter ATP-binding protein/permease [Bdellovibrionales bacterium]|nr:ABC transporter ATP-binding protein/permease [Bdellovibrionales bacterium]